MRKFGISSLCALLVMSYMPLALAQQNAPEKKKAQSKPATSQQSPNRQRKKESDQANRQGRRAEQGKQATRKARLSQLSDLHLATWILAENQVQVRMSEFAKGQVKTPQVKEFATQMATTHRELVAKMHKPIEALARDGKGETGQDGPLLDYSAIFAAVGKRLEEARRSDRQTRAYRGGEESTQPDKPKRDKPGRDKPQVDKPERKRTEGEGLFGANVVDGDAREMLRRNLPMLIDLLERSVEGTDVESTGLAFIALKRQLSERFADSAIEEMKRSEDKDQAYLGFEVAAHLKMIDTMEVAKQHASPELKLVLEDGIEMMKEHLKESRRLMKLAKIAAQQR